MLDQTWSGELLDMVSVPDGPERVAQRVPWTADEAAKRASEGHLTALRTVIAAEPKEL